MGDDQREDDDMFIEEIIRTYANDPDFKDDLSGYTGGQRDESVNDEQNSERDAIIAQQIFMQRERRRYFNQHILPFTNWGKETLQTSSHQLPGTANNYPIHRGTEVCFENIFNTYRPAEGVACYTGCIHKCSCHDYDNSSSSE